MDKKEFNLEIGVTLSKFPKNEVHGYQLSV